MKSCYGCTRHVFLTKKYAIKIPQFHYEWRHFLLGMLANMQEVTLSQTKDLRICPVLFSLCGGWLLIMPRCKEISREEFLDLDETIFHPTESGKEHKDETEWNIPCEIKEDSFGWYKERIVAVDYGS